MKTVRLALAMALLTLPLFAPVASATYTFRIGSLDQSSGGTLATGIAFSGHPVADVAVVRLDRSVAATSAPLGTTSDLAVRDTVQIYRWGAPCTAQPEINCQSPFLKVAGTHRVTRRGAIGSATARSTLSGYSNWPNRPFEWTVQSWRSFRNEVIRTGELR
jgi:hypothetical protein